MSDPAPLPPPPADCFFEPLGGERYLATAATAGPWDPGAQHGGPPSALLGRAIERTPSPGPAKRVAASVVVRATCEILGPIPVGEVTASSRVVRPGRSVELVEATLEAAGRPAARMLAWRVVPAPADVPVAERASLPWPVPERAVGIPPGDWHDGYLTAIEWRFVDGRFDRPGPATAWTRARVPLVAGEQPTPLQRTLLIADTGNGISGVLPMGEWWYINPELTVHLHRPAEGEWLAVEARTVITPGGAGLAESRLHDHRGPIGRGAQALLVARRT
ncbi:MAG: thioesterase family protein [Frankiaceae bacterium]